MNDFEPPPETNEVSTQTLYVSENFKENIKLSREEMEELIKENEMICEANQKIQEKENVLVEQITLRDRQIQEL